jgi:chorismate mutase
MLPSSRESELALLREALAQLNSEIFIKITERRELTLKIQEFKDVTGRFSHYDPEREQELFLLFQKEFELSSIKELLAFSLMMEDQAMAKVPDSYPQWSGRIHLCSNVGELYEMINPLILRGARPDFFSKLSFHKEFIFLKDF